MPPPQSRRMTLGVVNMNSRNSLGGGVRTETPNKAYKQKPPSGRVSMLPRVGRENIIPPSPARSVVSTTTASSRRRSVGGVDHRRASSTALIKQDPRPVTDKACQNICIKRLLEYLIKSGYDFPISQKTLNKPSGKDFANIVTFLIRKIEPQFQNGMLKLEDEIAMNFKALGYPFPVSKTALVAAGSPHTWPTLLAALTWLTEHLIFIEAQKEEEANENLDKPFESLDELEGKTDKAFFNFLDGAYLAFLRGDQQQSDQLTDDLMEMVEHDNMIIERDIDRVTDLNAAFVEKMNHLSQESEPLPTLAQKREDYATDLEQFHDLVRQMDEHKGALENKVKERSAELQESEGEFEVVTQKVTIVKQRIHSQDLSVNDVCKMQVDIERDNDALVKISALKQQKRETFRETQTDVKKVSEDLEVTVESDSATYAELAILADNAGVLKISIDLDNSESGNQLSLLGVNLRTDVSPFLADFQVEEKEEMAILRQQTQHELDQQVSKEALMTEVMDNVEIVENRIAKCEESVEKEREQTDAAMNICLREGDVFDTKIESLRNPVAFEEEIVRYQRQHIQLKALQIKYRDENICEEKVVHDEINSALLAIKDHNTYVQAQLTAMKQHAIQQRSKLLSVIILKEEPNKCNQ